MFRLRLLGGTDLRNSEGGEVRSILAQSKRLALLSYLAVNSPFGYQRRDKLLGLFWPEMDQERARAALRQSLHFLRRSFEGVEILETRGKEEIALKAGECWCDVVAFQEAAEAGNWEGALALYGGDLLEGLFLKDCPAFEEWLEWERERLRELAAGVAWSGAQALLEANDPVKAERVGQRALGLSCTDESQARRFIAALAEAGDRAAALRFHQKFVDTLARSFEVEPSPETQELAAELRTGIVADTPDHSRWPPAEKAVARTGPGVRRGAKVEATPVAGSWKRLAIGFGALALLAVLVGLAAVLVPDPPPPVVRQRLHPPGEGARTNWARYFALAPDGSSMVYRDTVGLRSGWQLWVKERQALEGRVLPGTPNAREVVYSPNGQSIAFVAGTNLIKRPLQGGVGVTLFENVADNPVALDWLADGTILCEQEGNTLIRISESGEAPPDTVFVFTPDLPIKVRGLPGERAALTVACLNGQCARWSRLYIVDLQADTAWVVQDQVLDAWYVPTGHVVWVRRDGTVFATPFDLDRLQMSDNHRLVLEGVRTSTTTADMEIGENGTVVFIQGTIPRSLWEPVWVDREGQETPMVTGLAGETSYPALSPDGTQLAVVKGDGDDTDIWIADLIRGSRRRLSFQGGISPAWHPDGHSVAFHSYRGGARDLWTKRADGTGGATLLADWDRDMLHPVWSPDSARLVFQAPETKEGPGGILAWPVGGDPQPVPLVVTESFESAPALSPDGSFLAYASDESGEYQVYVVPFPEVKWRIQVSTGGGGEPVWSKDGRELFYRRPAGGHLVAVEVETTDPFRLGEEHVLFAAGKYRGFPGRTQYDVAPDGRRFVMLRPLGQVEALPEPRMIWVENFFTELERPSGGRD